MKKRKNPTQSTGEKIPAGPTCYFPAGRGSCCWAAPHPLTGKRCCSRLGNLQLDSIYKLEKCMESEAEEIT